MDSKIDPMGKKTTETTTLRGALVMSYPSALGPADEPLTIEWPEGVEMDSIDQLYAQALTTMEQFVHRLDKRVPPPQLVTHRGAHVFRHEEKAIGQAIVQKLVRMVSTLHAARLLQTMDLSKSREPFRGSSTSFRSC